MSPEGLANSNPRNEKAYKRYHAAVWPDVTKAISSADFGLSLARAHLPRDRPRLSAYNFKASMTSAQRKLIISSKYKIFLDSGSVHAIACSSFKCLDRCVTLPVKSRSRHSPGAKTAFCSKMTVLASRKPLVNSQGARSCPVCRENSHDGQNGRRVDLEFN
jgi:hypothetical protein